MKRNFKKFVAVMLLASMLLLVARCGYIIYPERRGVTSGQIDPVVLVMDCFWLLVFVVPGVVALVVDFVAGGMYGESGLNKKSSAAPGNLIDFRLKGAAPANAEVSVLIMSPDSQKTVAVLLDKHFIQGDVLQNSQYLQIPNDIQAGEYKLAVLIDGLVANSYDLQIVQ